MDQANVKNPTDINSAFEKGYNEQNVDWLMSLYEPDATLVKQNGGLARGLSAIRDELEAFLQLGGSVQSVNQYAIEHDDLALIRADWKVTTQDEQGNELIIDGSSAEVARKQSDGRWLYIADHPTGGSSEQ